MSMPSAAGATPSAALGGGAILHPQTLASTGAPIALQVVLGVVLIGLGWLMARHLGHRHQTLKYAPEKHEV